MNKLTNNNVETTTQRTKDQATRNPLKHEGELGCSERVSSSCSTCSTYGLVFETSIPTFISDEMRQ